MGERYPILNACNDEWFGISADVNGDGLNDMLLLGSSATCVTHPYHEYVPELHVLSILLGREDDTLAPPVSVPTGLPASRVIAITDVDEDGIDDIVVEAEHNVWLGSHAWLPGVGDGTFLPGREVTERPGLLRGIGDFDGDGDVDGLYILTIVPDFEGAGDNDTIRISDSVIGPTGVDIMGLDMESLEQPSQAVADFNRDGVADIISKAPVDLPADDPSVFQRTGILLSRP